MEKCITRSPFNLDGDNKTLKGQVEFYTDGLRICAGDRKQWIPMEGNRSLHIALGRIPSGAVEGGVAIEHWEVVAGGPDESEIQDQWNLWDGGLGE